MKKIVAALLTSLIGTSAFADDAVNDPAAATIDVKPKKQTVTTKKQDYKGTVDKNTTDSQETQHLTGNFDLTTNYVFRGISQTTNLPAVQGGFTYTFDSGIYLNIWGSNVRFIDTPATVEFDTIIGYSNTFKDLGYNISFDRYNYPKATELAYNEGILVLTYNILQLTLAYSPNEYNTHTSGNYASLAVNYTIPSKYIFNVEDFSVNASFGHSNLSSAAGGSYNDYSIWVSKVIDKYTLTLQWASTNGHQNNPPFDRNLWLGTVAVNV